MSLASQFVNLLAALLLLIAFAMLSQRRILTLIHLFAWQGAALAASTFIVAYSTGQGHLYFSAILTVVLKVILIPWVLHRLIDRLNVRWDVETLINIPTTMLIGIGLAIFAFALATPISQMANTLTRSTLGIALASVLLSFLMMIVRRKAVPQVIGFLAMENGLFFAATSATYGMPLVVELGRRARRARRHVHLRHLLLPYPRAVRQPRHPAHGKAEGRLTMEIVLVLGIPLFGALLLALVGHRRWAAELNAATSFATFCASVLLTIRVVADGPMLALDEQFFVDPFNVFLVALTAFVGFTTALFSRPYMRIEEQHGRLNAARLRLYHSMYQLFSFTMALCLLSNNVGILWVALEGATLSTVLLVSLYRTPASLEAAWKYFILCSVGNRAGAVRRDPAVLRGRESAGARAARRSCGRTCTRCAASSSRPCSRSRSSSCSSGSAPRSASCPLHNWLPDAHAEGPTPISAVLSGLLLNVGLYAVVRSKVLVDGALERNFLRRD
jgi:hydrogenase-4 membrane subunit HyfE